MKDKEYSELKEKVSHGNFHLPMEIYNGEITKNWGLYLHWHDEMEIVHIKSGSGFLYLDLKLYPIEEGDFVIIKKGSLHYLTAENSSILKYEAMVFDLSLVQNPLLDYCQLEFIDPILKNKLYLKAIIKKYDMGYKDILDCFNKISNSHLKKDFGFQLEIKGLLFLLLFHIFNKNYIKKDKDHTLKQAEKLGKIKQVINYIEINYNRPISINELAEICGYSVYHFIRFFKANTGKTCTEFINSIRIEKAADLLVKTNLSITEIAYELGFSDVSYFIKIFKKYYLKSPNAYRKFYHK